MVDEAIQQLSEEELADLSVRCLTLQLYGMTLLLPNTMVAEVTDATEVLPAANTPDWLEGFVSWRGRSVPLVSFEHMLGQETIGRHDESRMVVINTLNEGSRVPFFAMEIHGLPHLSLLKDVNLEYDEADERDEPVILSVLKVDDESVTVPNVDVIERMLENLGISS